MASSSVDFLTVEWLQEGLKKALDFDETADIARYIMSMDNADDRDNYLKDILDPARSADFFIQFRARNQKRYCDPSDQGLVAYRKKERPSVSVAQPSQAPQAPASQAKKSGQKFSPLFCKEDVVMIKGRHPCDCQAQKHDLVNNCLACGKVICAQEGSGPCLFCGQLVCSKEEQAILDRNSKKSEGLRKKLMSVGSKKAEEQKERLLEYDRTSEKRTTVIDDQSDYFSLDNNQWLTPDQRKALMKRQEEIQAQRHGSRFNKTFTFDFAGRAITEEQSNIPIEADVLANLSGPKSSAVDTQLAKADVVIKPTLVGSSHLLEQDKNSFVAKPCSKVLRLQDPQLQEMSDRGMCLSMHQPWASYLVSGIKVHEGRTWYTAHRGRLWIHAASKPPDPVEVSQIQDLYRSLYKGRDLPFPSQLPVSCLLGCVDVEDCLGQEEYRERFPQGESNSPFVLICVNPKELAIKLPMAGQHKIYKLDSRLHQAAKGLMKF